MSIKKQLLKSKPICKVTFRVEPENAAKAETIHILGDFNDWNVSKNPMKKLKNGSFTLTLDLETGRDYQFRYLINEATWMNDSEADATAPSGYIDAVNSVLSI